MAGMSQLVRPHGQRALVNRGNNIRLLVAMETLLIGGPLRVKHPAEFVRLVAINTGREHMLFLLPELSTDHLFVHRLDFRMAMGAGRSNILTGNGRAIVCVGQDEVCRMARCAGGGYHEPPF